MKNRPPREELLKVVDASPKAVAMHDKQTWLSIFAKESIVEDPVGSSPHCTRVSERENGKKESSPLERFYDTFIAPNEIKFHVDRDVVTGNTVIRDLNIEIKMSKGLFVYVPMHLFYELNDEDGQLKICHLSAHWELFKMIKQVMNHGLPGLHTMTKLGIRMIMYQGIIGALGFSKGFLGIHQKGKDGVRDFVMAANSKNTQQLTTLFCSNNTGVEFPAEGSIFSPDDFADTVDIKINVSKMISSGFITTFTFDADYNRNAYHGVGRFEFDSKTRKIKNARFFWDEGDLKAETKGSSLNR